MSVGEKLVTITENMTDIYGRAYVGGFSEGHEVGYKIGYDKGVDIGTNGGFTVGYDKGSAAGKQSEYDLFWDANQKNGQRTNYQYAYLGNGFSFDNFYPKYDIAPKGAFNQAFALWNSDENVHKGNLAERLVHCGVKMDLSKATAMMQAFYRGYFTHLPAIHLPGGITNHQIFGDCVYLETVDKLIVDEKTVFSECFKGAVALENIQFEGVIGQNGLDFSACPLLRRESMLSAIGCLKDYSGTSGTYRIVFGAVNLAKLTEEEIKAATDKGWSVS